MKFERQIAANEADLASVDVVFLQFGISVGVEPLAIGALVVSELDKRDRRVGTAEGVPSVADAHLHFFWRRGRTGLLWCHHTRQLDLLLFEQLANLLQLRDDGIRLLLTDPRSEGWTTWRWLLTDSVLR